MFYRVQKNRGLQFPNAPESLRVFAKSLQRCWVAADDKVSKGRTNPREGKAVVHTGVEGQCCIIPTEYTYGAHQRKHNRHDINIVLLYCTGNVLDIDSIIWRVKRNGRVLAEEWCCTTLQLEPCHFSLRWSWDAIKQQIIML